MKTKSTAPIHYKTSGFKPRRIVVLAILAAIIVVSAGSGLLYYRSINRYIFTDSATYMSDGMPIDIFVDDRIVIFDDNDVELKAKNSDMDTKLDSTPVYFNEKDAILLTTPMSYVKSGVTGFNIAQQVDRFTKFETSYDEMIISKRSKKHTEKGNFLFDGNDTYIVLSEATLKIGDDKEITLSPLSYVECAYGSWVMYYDRSEDEFQYITFKPTDENKSINLEFDDGMVAFCDLDRVLVGTENFMLITEPTVLPSLF